jgi:myo-inositol-1(or 4)-monophosphatase
VGAGAPARARVSEADASAPGAAEGDADSAGGEEAHSRELLALAVQAARMAGELLTERARHGVEREVAAKSTPTDLVSEADLASEHAICELLAARRPADGFVGEEGGSAREGDSGVSWVVDPLDGTVNFLFGIPQWCVSVAARDRDGVLAGAVYDPNRDELFTATREGPAVLESAEGQRRLEGRSHAVAAQADTHRDGGELATAMIATGLYYDARVRAAQAKVLERLVSRVRDIRRFGSAALDLVWTAAGRYDAYFERGVKEWDIAAGALICRRAGLEVLELAPADPLPRGILAAPAALASSLMELLSAP